MERVSQTKKRQEEREETVSTKGRCRSGDIKNLNRKKELKKAQLALQQQQAAQGQAHKQEMMRIIRQQQSQNMTALLVQQQPQFMCYVEFS
ncbi:unnamed protein product [Pocillopora meandrina]|uniref:Small EDRK-rich factor-like N-terminal domain-containing protein n=1 Tax=Pocillopora meandrina TaxID=46732 RepID=A0AAU9VQE9_9CNID|nr:unnamed protein product [Pocillopora meandrina]